MPKGMPNKIYSGEFKIKVVETMRKENLSFKETARQFEIRSDRQVRNWERIYLEEGREALLVERRGRACSAGGTQKGQKPRLDKQIEEDLIAENQRLRMEIDYLKKLNALVLEEERQNKSTSSPGTKAEVSTQTIAAACRTSSQHILLLFAPISKSSEVPDGEGRNHCNLQ